jgi:hypothetical protein
VLMVDGNEEVSGEAAIMSADRPAAPRRLRYFSSS